MALRIAPLCALLLVAAMIVACGNDDDGNDEPLRVSAEAELVDDGAPVEISATAIEEDADGFLSHVVRVEWNGDEGATLDDARFTHAVEGENGGHLVISGRGCGADWDEATEQVVHPCTADLQLVRLEPGESHDYPVRIHPEVGPLSLDRGTYVVEETIRWWLTDDPLELPDGDPDGEFTVRLRYTVE